LVRIDVCVVSGAENRRRLAAEHKLAAYHRRRRAAIRHLGGRCAACGATTRLEFDHVDPSRKTLSVSRAWSVAAERFWAEIEACQLLCTECHLAKTLEQRSAERDEREAAPF
jgi:5-methylcytosine-specific restriction endonuclease McrA